jgi:two-component system, response regulator YesN
MANLLIVDDEPVTLAGLSQTIPWRSYGIHAVFTAENGAEAVELLHDKHIDILITDIRMPVLNGLSLIDHVYDHLPDVRMIILSGYHDFSYAQHAIKKQVIDYLLKPVRVAELTQIVSRLADRIHQGLADTISLEGSPHKLIQDALKYMFSHMHEPLSLSLVAHEVQLSPNYFSVLFKQSVGKSFSTVINEIRIEKAAELLTETTYTLEAIAERIGYSDYKYFSRKFKEINGCSPGRYRNQIE